MALPSKTAFGSLFLNFKNNASVKIQDNIESAITLRLDMPNIYTPAMPAGIREIITAHMIFFVVWLDLICGLWETVSLFIFIFQHLYAA